MDKGSNKLSNNQTLQKQLRKISRKKHFSQHLAYGLFYSHELSEYHPLRKGYIKTIYCGEELIPDMKNGKKIFTSKSCKARWCPRCQSIRMARLIQQYGPTLSQMEDLYFVTLTAPTVGKKELPAQIEAFQKRWYDITRQRYWIKNKPVGIRKTECTIRPEGKYHYHWHIIIQGKKHAKWIVKQWLQRCPEAKKSAQDVRPVRKGEWLEIFKYFTKLIAKDKSTEKRFIDFKRLDYIMQVMQGKRVYQPFGGLKKAEGNELEEDVATIEVPEEYDKFWRWMTGIGYIDPETGEVLTGDYELPKWVEILAGEITPEKEKQVEETAKKRN